MGIEEDKQQKEKLTYVLSELAQFDPSNLGRADLGEPLNFQRGVPIFARTLNLFKALSECNLDNVPANKLSPIIQSAIQARDRFSLIKDFSILKYPQNPMTQRDTLIQQVEGDYESTFGHVSPIIAFAVRLGTDFARLEATARESVDKLSTMAESNQKLLHQKVIDAEATLEKVKRAAQEVGVAQHNLLFKAEADEHKTAAKHWLIATGTLAAVTLLAAIGLLCLYLRSTDLADKLQSPNLIAVKIVIFGLLISGTLWAGRTYRAHQHNYVVNKHRANALSTFETFVKGASDGQTKDAVLLQSTQCIFSAQPSGYITQEGDQGIYKQVHEIFRDTRKA